MEKRTSWQWAQWLLSKGFLRQLDIQLANVLRRHGASDEVALLASITSAEVGKGHICLAVEAQNNGQLWSERLGLFGENAAAFVVDMDAIDWPAQVKASSLVSQSDSGNQPLVFDAGLLYLQRYWQYEQKLANRLKSLATVVSLDRSEQERLRSELDHLFARQYSYLLADLDKARGNNQNTLNHRKMLAFDHLDIVDDEGLDWSAIDEALSGANSVNDLLVLDQLVPLKHCVSWQKVAASAALTRRFTVISGGPGTGKTTTVTKLLTVLLQQAQQRGESPTIKLVAPTGKAAARLTESIGNAVQELPIDPSLKDKIPTDASTIHRLLGAIPNSVEFRHNKHNPLHLDVLVVDEASMVDLPMMYRLAEALPDHARLILLGDKDQLSSVEAGAVLGDIFSYHAQGYSEAQGETLAELTSFDSLKTQASGAVSLADCLCMLQKSYRFDARSGIGQLAKAINSGNKARVTQVWNSDFSDIQHFPLSADNYTQLLTTLTQEYAHYLNMIEREGMSEDLAQKAKAVLRQFGQCRLLCAVREGDFGVQGLNERIERSLNHRGLITKREELWYAGRPVMVTRNDASSGLFNGDIGICLPVFEEDRTRLKVFFELPDGSVKAILPSRVPEHETAFAMTIHKSQGSEFAFTLMILPPDFSPILTRELIYTGVTRAKSRLALYADEAVMNRGIQTRTERHSGLIARLK
ncbi:exodeoxyribonuclease V subunit alpha [Vibrio astriarenae]|uniref:RecBCD enzyme subunit RecD n=1 Tax=Vibrio astriarenae TaxID=1481923 RepID=A0A7Z2T1I9_9VIBR|nr:exodeoxyribonuclease V subunit alpha [Vibrio astriarenae]QIA62624.1 exodeoxyribonuclease V subunit alpha [Vibrio astriarenae]